MQITDHLEQSRFELIIDEHVTAIEIYELTDDRIMLYHTEVLESFMNQGLAHILVTKVLAEVRSRGLGVIPECPYVRGVIADNPDQYLDLVPADIRLAYDLPA